MTSGRSSLVVPDTKAGDRPFSERPYGRLRMNEAMAKEAQRIFGEEIGRLLDQRGVLPEGPALEDVRRALKNTHRLNDNLRGLMEEKGW